MTQNQLSWNVLLHCCNAIGQLCLSSPGALSTRQKFRFEISENLRARWKDTIQLHRPDPSHCPFGYCSFKQDTKERYWGQQFCQMERDISVRLTKMTRRVKVATFKAGPEYSNSFDVPPKFPEFEVDGKAPPVTVVAL